jgi:hypothetical protein
MVLNHAVMGGLYEPSENRFAMAINACRASSIV